MNTKHFVYDREETEIKPRFINYTQICREATMRELFAMVFEKWEFLGEIVDEGEELTNDGGVNTCPFCRAFNSERNGPDNCDGCPIYEMDDHQFCQDTPYEDFENKDDEEYSDDEIRGVINNEIFYLKDLFKRWEEERDTILTEYKER